MYNITIRPYRVEADHPCYGCKRNTYIGCTIFYNIENEAIKCPCTTCVVKPICTKVCVGLQRYVDVTMLKGGIAI